MQVVHQEQPNLYTFRSPFGTAPPGGPPPAQLRMNPNLPKFSDAATFPMPVLNSVPPTNTQQQEDLSVPRSLMISPLAKGGRPREAQPGEPANKHGHYVGCRCCRCKDCCKSWLLD